MVCTKSPIYQIQNFYFSRNHQIQLDKSLVLTVLILISSHGRRNFIYMYVRVCVFEIWFINHIKNVSQCNINDISVPILSRASKVGWLVIQFMIKGRKIGPYSYTKMALCGRSCPQVAGPVAKWLLKDISCCTTLYDVVMCA